jgi:hypothetical protein
MTTAATSKYTCSSGADPSGRRSKAIVIPVMPASPHSSATTDHVHAASVPRLTRVSIVAVAWRRLRHAARWKDQPA